MSLKKQRVGVTRKRSRPAGSGAPLPQEQPGPCTARGLGPHPLSGGRLGTTHPQALRECQRTRGCPWGEPAFGPTKPLCCLRSHGQKSFTWCRRSRLLGLGGGGGACSSAQTWAARETLQQCCQALGFCISSVEPTIPAPSRRERSRDSNRREGGTVPFKNMARLALNAWPAGRSSEPDPTPTAARHLPANQVAASAGTGLRCGLPACGELWTSLQPGWCRQLNYLLTTSNAPVRTALPLSFPQDQRGQRGRKGGGGKRRAERLPGPGLAWFSQQPRVLAGDPSRGRAE